MKVTTMGQKHGILAAGSANMNNAAEVVSLTPWKRYTQLTLQSLA